MTTLPIIDFADWYAADTTPEKKAAVAKALTDACQKVGFVYIVNHCVSAEKLDEAFSWGKKLFDLDPQQKMLAPHPDGYAVHRGYSWPGLEKVSQEMGDKADESGELVHELRKIQDVKVVLSLSLPLSPSLSLFLSLMK